jgi:ribulose-bisphosphate carboxylase large chain
MSTDFAAFAPRAGGITPASVLDADYRGFVAPPRDLLAEDHLYFDYSFVTHDDPLAAALHLCREQSTAMWNRPGVAEDYRPAHAAKLVDLASHAVEAVEVGLAPTSQATHLVHVRLAHPALNFGPRLPNLLTAACGEGAFFTPGIRRIRLQDLHLPASFMAAFAGPRFGVAGIRELLGATDRPIVTGVVKPNIGLPIEHFAHIAEEALRGGTDIAKDDEMLGDVDYSPLRERARAVFEGVRRAAAATGEGKIFLANITDEVDRVLDLHDMVYELGGKHAAVMLNALCMGLSACRMVAKRTRVPLVSHFDFIAAFGRDPYHGVADRVMTRLQRLAGFDMIIMPGLGGRMHQTEAEVLENVRICLEPMGHLAPALPVPGGSDWAGSLPGMIRAIGHTDFSIVCGRGIFGHPDGAAAGGRSVRDAWSALSQHQDPRSFSDPLRRAYEAFGG